MRCPLISAFPSKFQSVLMFHHNNQKVTESVNLHINKMKNLPYSWKVSLVDRKTGQTLTPSKGFDTNSITASLSKQVLPHILQQEYKILSNRPRRGPFC
ncbi:MAG: hypothetical protein U5J63_16300, partial [Fodinibius sp.]|nr:hypothetical protein [Fodinibius sp.]